MLKDITLGQFCPGSTVIHRMDPRVKMLLMIAYIALVFLVKGFLGYLILAVYLGLAIALAHLKIQYMMRSLKPILFIVVMTLVLNILFTRGEHPLVEWGILKIYREGIEFAVFMALRLIFLLLGTSLLTLTTSPMALTDALERLVNENLSNDTNTDLFVLSSFMINSHSIFSRGFAAPIYSETLQQSINRMYPQIQALLMQDDVLWGYPVNLYPDFWAVRPALLEKYGYAVPETMDEYVDMLLDWYTNHADEDENIMFNENRTIRAQQVKTASMLLSQYILTHADGDTFLSVQSPQLSASIEKLTSLSNIQEADAASDTLDHAASESLFQTGNATLPFYRRLNPEHAGEVCMTVPTFGDGTGHVNNCSLEYFIINPHSEKQEAAVTFLEYLCNHMDTVTAYQCYPDENTPVETEGNREEILELQDSIDRSTASIELDQKQIEMATEFLMNAAEGSEDYDFYMEYLSELQTSLDMSKNNIVDWTNQKAELEENLYVYAAEDIAEHRKLAQDMELQNSWIVWEMSNELDIDGMFEKYFDGYASLQQTLSEIDKRLLLMLYEEN